MVSWALVLFEWYYSSFLPVEVMSHDAVFEYLPVETTNCIHKYFLVISEVIHTYTNLNTVSTAGLFPAELACVAQLLFRHCAVKLGV